MSVTKKELKTQKKEEENQETDVFQKIASSLYFHFLRSNNIEDLTHYYETCEKTLYPNSIENPSCVYVDNYFEFILTVPPKVASCSWLWMIGKLYNHTFTSFDILEYTKATGIRPLHSYSYEERKYVSKKYIKIITVRHPWNRLVSAYEDKITNDIYKIHKIKTLINGTVMYSQEKVVTFSDFVQYLIDIEIHKYDPRKIKDDSFYHFAPMYIQSDPCKIHYDLILKLENMEDDFPQLNDILFRGAASMLHRHSHINVKNHLNIVKSFMTQLSDGQYKKLYIMFKPDFDLFNYDTNVLTTI